MEIPASSLINRYIACQGPLPNTCPDFWQMTWEQGSSLVVMLTTQVERGRVRRPLTVSGPQTQRLLQEETSIIEMC